MMPVQVLERSYDNQWPVTDNFMVAKLKLITVFVILFSLVLFWGQPAALDI